MPVLVGELATIISNIRSKLPQGWINPTVEFYIPPEGGTDLPFGGVRLVVRSLTGERVTVWAWTVFPAEFAGVPYLTGHRTAAPMTVPDGVLSVLLPVLGYFDEAEARARAVAVAAIR